MSYNITAWRTKRLEGLTIPLQVLLSVLAEAGWGFSLCVDSIAAGMLHLRGSPTECSVIGGNVGRGPASLGALLVVDEIGIWGEGSRGFLDVLIDVLKQSTGVLEAMLVWEGGDRIERLLAQDGEVTRKEVEL